ncbi:MAG: isoleucine--tRNA ligase [Candidatus Aenigmarchaeota archaeon]|nr:isoleucine--tRNA ligase [Candidatus Aenigmarchaeota archaeon]
MYNFKKIEEEIREYWQKIEISKKLTEFRKGKQKFYLLDGPPYVNARPHVGHIKTTTCKDIWTKFKLMQGYDAWIQAGFDCHGLPIEVMVEKDMEIKSKSDIENKIGVENFIKSCLEKVENNERAWLSIYQKLGAWRGFYEPYLTNKKYYMLSAWWSLKKLYEKGMLVRGEYPIHWCPHCETALAGYEVSDSYRNVTDPAIYIKFKLKGKNEFIIVYTTTPWTLVANVALAVHPEETYVKLKVGDEIYIVAEKRLEYLKDILQGEIIDKIKGKDLEGVEYEPLLSVPQQKEISKDEKAHRIYMSISIMKRKKYKKHETGQTEEEEFEEFVTMDEGTGVVHVAPGHGPSDYRLGKHYDLPIASPVDEKGKFTEEAGEFSGLFVKDADNLIIEKLKEEGKLLYAGKVTHSYPVCWRCKTPLIFRMSKQWYLKVEPIKEKMIEANESVKWMPSHAKIRFHNWLENRDDWCISQQRFYGIPLPIWECEKCGHIEVIGSEEELKEKAITNVNLDDLHRHVVDQIELKCPKCGEIMKRVKDIFNVWFDSGIAPWASVGYPFNNKELFERMFPCDLIVESQDQIRGWFDSLMFTSMGTFDKPPYRAVGMTGWVVDEKGEKMSKSVGNVVWADEALNKLGADALRLYYAWETSPWETQKFSLRSCQKISRDLNILWNVYQFYKMYSKYWDGSYEEDRTEDRWIISRVNSLNEAIVRHMENFEFHVVGRLLVDFIVNDLSRTYVKLIRDRTWPYYDGKDKGNAFRTLLYVLEHVVKMLAPITPFITEKIYQDLFKEKESVHLEDWPKVEKDRIDEELEEGIRLILQAVELANARRHEIGIKLRYPLKLLIVKGKKEDIKKMEKLSNAVKILANVKDVHFEEGSGIELDETVDEELKNEWLLRELVRAIQAERKKLGLVVEDRLHLYLPKELKVLETFKDIIEYETGSEAEFVPGGQNKLSLSFEGMNYEIGFDVERKKKNN